MKALSLTQPWATLVAIRAKRIETRSWRTLYRGPVAIHAAKSFPPGCREMAEQQPFCGALMFAPADSLPLGKVIATATLVDCLQFGSLEWKIRESGLGPLEKEFGDFTPGRWGFVLEDVKVMDTPVPARGALGLWEWNP